MTRGWLFRGLPWPPLAGSAAGSPVVEAELAVAARQRGKRPLRAFLSRCYRDARAGRLPAQLPVALGFFLHALQSDVVVGELV